MILRVLLKNFLSFDDDMQFDMFANAKRTSLLSHVMKPDDKVQVLKMAAIYGANGAGKTNLLKAINFIKAFATEKNFVNKSNIGKYFFALKKDTTTQPMELAVEFVTKQGVPLIYAIEISKSGIKHETLQISGLGTIDNKPVFVRENDKVEFSQKPSSEIERIVNGWIEKNQFASLLTINNNDLPVLTNENIEAACKWFHDELVIIGLHSFNPHLIDLFRKNKQLYSFATKLFAELDLGINSLKVETENFEDWITTHDTSDLPVDEVKKLRTGVLSQVVDFRNTRAISVEKGVQKISQILFEQFGKDDYSRDMDIQAQSDGTVRLLSLVPALYEAMKVGKTVFIDELDHSIHPHLVRELVRYFSKQKTEGQLIFTTHQTCLLNQDFIRTDEVWLAEKKDGCSHLYSLNEFKIHNTINIENGYLDGRYGAIPFIGDINM